MLSPRLTNCVECTTIPVLLNEIDCKIAQLAGNLYNNIVFMLNQPVQANVMIDLLNYRRILTFKYCNPDYAGCFTIPMIASKVKILTVNNKPIARPSCGTTTTTTTNLTSTTTTTQSPNRFLLGNSYSSAFAACQQVETYNYYTDGSIPSSGVTLYFDQARTITANNIPYLAYGGNLLHTDGSGTLIYDSSCSSLTTTTTTTI